VLGLPRPQARWRGRSRPTTTGSCPSPQTAHPLENADCLLTNTLPMVWPTTHTLGRDLSDVITLRCQVVLVHENRRGQPQLLSAGSFSGGQPAAFEIAHDSGIAHDLPPHQSL
jgi:hypothetical protein